MTTKKTASHIWGSLMTVDQITDIKVLSKGVNYIQFETREQHLGFAQKYAVDAFVRRFTFEVSVGSCYRIKTDKQQNFVLIKRLQKKGAN